MNPRNTNAPSRRLGASIRAATAVVLLSSTLVACSDDGITDPVVTAAADSITRLNLGHRASRRPARSYSVILTAYEADGSRSPQQIHRSRRSVGGALQSVASGDARPGQAGAGGRAAVTSAFERMMLRGTHRPSHPSSRPGAWREERWLDADERVLVVTEGHGRAPSQSLSFYRNGVLQSRIRERWHQVGDGWELAYREVELPQANFRGTAEFEPQSLPTPGPLSVEAGRILGTESASTSSATYGECTAEDADIVCALEKAAATASDEAVAQAFTAAVIACGTTLILAPTGPGAVIGMTACTMAIWTWDIRVKQSNIAWGNYHECVRRARGATAPPPSQTSRTPFGSMTSASPDPSGRLRDSAANLDVGSCGSPGSGGVAGGTNSDGYCVYWVEWDTETGEVLSVQLLYCMDE